MSIARGIDLLLLLALVLVVGTLAATAAPAIWEEPMSGQMLLIHMMASGALVVGMPLLAIWFLKRAVQPEAGGSVLKLGYWATVMLGTLTITTVFLCMLPLPSTEQMHDLMQVHGYAGFAMVPAVAVLLWGAARWRRIQLMR